VRTPGTSVLRSGVTQMTAPLGRLELELGQDGIRLEPQRRLLSYTQSVPLSQGTHE
jgi:hypothetical protein